MKKNPSAYGWVVKLVALVLALAGVFWARSQLQETAQTPSPVPASEQAPIPAKVEFGK